MNYELIDIGNNCLPNTLIRQILNNKNKQIFMLGIYNFNDICKYLENGIFEDIYNKDLLTYENSPILNFTDEIQSYSHKSIIKNKKLNFMHNHDFSYDISTNTITNYNFIVKEFDLKIQNFKEICKNQKLPIFINFTDNINNYKFKEVLDILQKYIHKKFYIFIFIYGIHKREISEYDNIKYIYLDNNFFEWWKHPKEIKKILYKEIYEKYIDIMIKLNININFIPFEECVINLY
jgi:hypothetical protein